MLVWIDIFVKILYRLRDIVCHYLRKPFIAKLGKGSYLKPGLRIIGNPYRIHIGANFKIWENCTLSIGKGRIELGNNGLLGVGTLINAGNNTVKIGDGVAIAQHCRIIAYSHHYKTGQLITDCFIEGDIMVGDDVLIGAGVTILPGVVIGKGAVIAAGAVVTKSIEPYTIAGGIPATKIKDRIK